MFLCRYFTGTGMEKPTVSVAVLTISVISLSIRNGAFKKDWLIPLV